MGPESRRVGGKPGDMVRGVQERANKTLPGAPLQHDDALVRGPSSGAVPTCLALGQGLRDDLLPPCHHPTTLRALVWRKTVRAVLAERVSAREQLKRRRGVAVAASVPHRVRVLVHREQLLQRLHGGERVGG